MEVTSAGSIKAAEHPVTQQPQRPYRPCGMELASRHTEIQDEIQEERKF